MLQNRQHTQTLFWGQIRHSEVSKWFSFTGLISSGSVYCVTHAGQKLPKIFAFSTKFSHFGWLFCSSPCQSGPNFGERQETHGLHLHAKFHLNPFIMSPSRDEKTQFWANFDIGGTCTNTILSMMSKLSVLE